MEAFAIHVFYPDGNTPEFGEQIMGDLSPRWLAVCSDLLSRYGPVMDHDMGSTLSHFSIRMGGPVGQLLAYRRKCFDFAISQGSNSDQDKATTQHFRSLLNQVTEAANTSLCGKAIAVLADAPSRRCLLVLDGVTPELDEDQKGALMQLGFHLAGAYYQYCESEPRQA